MTPTDYPDLRIWGAVFIVFGVLWIVFCVKCWRADIAQQRKFEESHAAFEARRIEFESQPWVRDLNERIKKEREAK